MHPTIDPKPLLLDDHRDMEAACLALLSRRHEDDPLELVAAYRRFEAAITEHFDAEEKLLLPRYAEQFPEHARQIGEEHEELRRMLLAIAVDVELHVIRADRLTALVDRLHAHAAFEDGTLYTWAAAQLSPSDATALASRLETSAHSADVHPLPAGLIEHTGYSR